MIVGDNGPVEPQIGYYDGYGVAERLLEGVRFRFQAINNELIWTGFHSADMDYMRQFADRQVEDWASEALNSILDGFEMQSADGKINLYWRP